MNCATDTPQELDALRAQLEVERLARAQAEARLEGFREAAALFLSARQVEAPPRHAPSRPVTRDTVTASVTPEDREERNRALARERKRNERARGRSVTPQRDSVTACVTQEKEEKNIGSTPPSSPAVTTVARGTLALVTAAARDAQRDRSREHRTPTTLPPEVQALRVAWNELAAPHGFTPWGERTSGKLLQDALSALERRPLEEWRKVFALVPRSPVCRGELSSRQRTSLVWLLTGKTRDGYEPADKLLGGGWSIDPEPGESTPPGPAGAPAQDTALAELPDDTPAASAWKRMLEALRADKREYALRWLAPLRAREVHEGELVLVAPDRYFEEWVREHYAELLRGMAGFEGLSSVRVTSPDVEGSP